MNVERLRQMCRVLEHVAHLQSCTNLKLFDLGDWHSSNMDTIARLKRANNPEPILLEAAEDRGCGTTACAVGWACLDPWFRSQGLEMTSLGAPKYTICNEESQEETLDSWDAVLTFFDLNYDDAQQLFSWAYYEHGAEVGPLQVRDRIVALLAEHETQSNLKGN